MGGPVTADALWDAAEVVVTAPVTVREGATLTIAAGARVVFDGYWGLTVEDGSLQAVGTPTAPIVLTSGQPEDWAPDGDTRGAWSGLTLDRVPAARDSTRLIWCEITRAKALPARDPASGRRGTTSAFADGVGGALRVIGPSPIRLEHSRLHHNLALRGGAVAARYGAAPLLVGNLFHDNHATLRGGALWLSYSTPILVHNTVIQNVTAAPDAFLATGAVDHTHADPRHVGGIYWGNPTSHHTDLQIREPRAALTRYCLVGGWPGGEGCLTGDPGLDLSGQPPGGPLPGAAVIDAGSAAAAAPWLPPRDLAGRSRVVGAAPDLGALEWQPVTAVASDPAPAPVVAPVLSAGPNPANPGTRLIWEQVRAGPVRLTVHDLAGRLVATVVAGLRPAGQQTADWSGRDRDGRRVAGGVYLVRLRSPSGTTACRLTVVP